MNDIKQKRKYLTTVHTTENDVVLVAGNAVNGLVETYCFGYSAKNKKIREPKFDGFYYNTELKEVKNEQ